MTDQAEAVHAYLPRQVEYDATDPLAPANTSTIVRWLWEWTDHVYWPERPQHEWVLIFTYGGRLYHVRYGERIVRSKLGTVQVLEDALFLDGFIRKEAAA